MRLDLVVQLEALVARRVVDQIHAVEFLVELGDLLRQARVAHGQVVLVVQHHLRLADLYLADHGLLVDARRLGLPARRYLEQVTLRCGRGGEGRRRRRRRRREHVSVMVSHMVACIALRERHLVGRVHCGRVAQVGDLALLLLLLLEQAEVIDVGEETGAEQALVEVDLGIGLAVANGRLADASQVAQRQVGADLVQVEQYLAIDGLDGQREALVGVRRQLRVRRRHVGRCLRVACRLVLLDFRTMLLADVALHSIRVVASIVVVVAH